MESGLMCLESWEDYGNLPNDPKGIHALLDRQCPKDMARQRACLTEWLPSGGCSKPDSDVERVALSDRNHNLPSETGLLYPSLRVMSNRHLTTLRITVTCSYMVVHTSTY